MLKLRNEINELAEKKKIRAMKAMQKIAAESVQLPGSAMTPFTSTAASGFTGINNRRKIIINSHAMNNKFAKTSENFNKTHGSFPMQT